jgi:uncharacterized protein (TIRG00374 family)
MDDEKRKFLIRSSLFLLIGVLIFVIYLVFFVNISEMIEKISQANLWVYALSFVAVLIDVFFFALAWRYLMRALSVKVSVKKTYAFMWISIFIDSIIPAESISGEISRAYLMSREPNAETGKVVVSLVVHRVIMVVITIATLFTGTLILFASHYPLSTLIMYLIGLVTVATFAFLAAVIVLCIKEKWMEKLVDLLLRMVVRIFRGRWHLEELREKALVELKSFYEGLKILRGTAGRSARSKIVSNEYSIEFGAYMLLFIISILGALIQTLWWLFPGCIFCLLAIIVTIEQRKIGAPPLIGPIVFSFVSWFFSVLVSFLVFTAMGFRVDWVLASIIIVVFSLSVMIKSVPIGVPAEVGLPELVMAVLYTELGGPMGITAAIASAVTILTRLVTFAFKFVIGFAAMQWIGIKTVMDGMKLGGQKDKV